MAKADLMHSGKRLGSSMQKSSNCHEAYVSSTFMQ